jgi:hypothetical protein
MTLCMQVSRLPCMTRASMSGKWNEALYRDLWRQFA